MKHEVTGVLAGRGGPARGAARGHGPDRLRCARGRRRLHRALDRVAARRARARGAGGRARGRGAAVTVPAAATAASPMRSGSACRCFVTATATDALAMRGRPGRGRGHRAFLLRAGGGRLVRRSGYLQLSAAPAQDGVWSEAVALCHGQLGEPEEARELSAEEVAKRCRSPRFRGGAFFPGARPYSPLGWRSACATGLRASPTSGSSSIHACTAQGRLLGLRRRRRPATVLARSCALALGRASNAAGLALSQPAHGHLEPHGDHRAGPGRVGGGRLDRGRVHHRQQGDAPLPAHDPGRAHRLRLGRGPDRLRRPAGRLHRARPRGRRPGDLRPALVLPGARGPLDRARVGRPDRRLAHPPSGGDAGRRGLRLRRLRLPRATASAPPT